MGKNRPKRNMGAVGQSQHTTEQATQDKFKQAEDLAIAPVKQVLPAGRISPQISCTVAPDDKQMLNEITMYAINKAGKPLNTSTIIRALIRLGHKMKGELEF